MEVTYTVIIVTGTRRSNGHESLSHHNGDGRGDHSVLAAAGRVRVALGKFTASDDNGNAQPGAQGVAAPGILYVSMGRQMSDQLTVIAGIVGLGGWEKSWPLCLLPPSG